MKESKGLNILSDIENIINKYEKAYKNLSESIPNQRIRPIIFNKHRFKENILDYLKQRIGEDMIKIVLGPSKEDIKDKDSWWSFAFKYGFNINSRIAYFNVVDAYFRNDISQNDNPFKELTQKAKEYSNKGYEGVDYYYSIRKFLKKDMKQYDINGKITRKINLSDNSYDFITAFIVHNTTEFTQDSKYQKMLDNKLTVKDRNKEIDYFEELRDISQEFGYSYKYITRACSKLLHEHKWETFRDVAYAVNQYQKQEGGYYFASSLRKLLSKNLSVLVFPDSIHNNNQEVDGSYLSTLFTTYFIDKFPDIASINHYY